MTSDLVNDSKLPVQFSAEYTYHVIFKSDPRPGQQVRRHRKEEVWRKVKHLGEGGFGGFWLEECLTSDDQPKCRAVKAISKVSLSSLNIDYTRELEAIAKFSQAKYEGLFVKSSGRYEDAKHAYIAMEHFELGDLQTHLGRPLPEREAQQIGHQLLEGLEQLHLNGFAHRDLKPANIFVVRKGPDWWVKIGDFGISKRVDEGRTSLRTKAVGTRRFIAPEVLESQEADLPYTDKVDMWSLGVLVHYMITATFPFDKKAELRRYIQGCDFPVSALASCGVSRECHDFITKGLMTATAASRLSASDALQHEWLEGFHNTGEVEVRAANASLESTEASARWSALNETNSQRSVRMAHPIRMTQRKAETHTSPEPMSSQVDKALVQRRAEITSMNEAGISLYFQQRYEEAETMLRQALHDEEKVFGKDHADTLNTAYWLGLSLYKQRKYKEAEAMFRRDLQGCEKGARQRPCRHRALPTFSQ